MNASKRNPPGWFAPALFGGMFVAVGALAGLGALLYDPPHAPITIGGRTLVIPPGDLSSLSLEPHLFVRIAPAGKPFHIVHDSRAAGGHDRTGVPLIFSVNDHGDHDVRYSRDGRWLVVCRRASSPAGGCGTWIRHGDATWSVLFPESRREDAEELAREAAVTMRGYDARATRLIP